MSNVVPGYTFLNASDSITYSKLNLLSTPTVSIGSNEVVTAMIADNSVTYAKLINVPQYSIMGRSTAGTGNYETIAGTQLSFAVLASSDAYAVQQALKFNDGSIATGNYRVGIGASASAASLQLNGTSGTLQVYGSSTDSVIEVGQSTAYRLRANWQYNATPANAGAVLSSNGYLTIQATGKTLTLQSGNDASFSIVSGGTRDNVKFGTTASALATTTTDGFPYLPTCAGTPTGVPTAYTGYVPMIFDTTGVKLWIYTGGAWKGVVVA